MSRIVGPSVINRNSNDAGYLLVPRNWSSAGVGGGGGRRCPVAPFGAPLADAGTPALGGGVGVAAAGGVGAAAFGAAAGGCCAARCAARRCACARRAASPHGRGSP